MAGGAGSFQWREHSFPPFFPQCSQHTPPLSFYSSTPSQSHRHRRQPAGLAFVSTAAAGGVWVGLHGVSTR